MKINFKDLFLLLLIFAIGFGIGGYYFQGRQIFQPVGVDFVPLFEAWQQIEDKFYNFSKEMRKEMLYGAIEGLVESLKDPYSDFLTQDETLELEETLKGAYEGIGAEIGIREEKLTIISPLKGTPAEKARLLPGDWILEINQVKTEDMSLTEAVMKIRGKTGTKVKLKIQRGKKIFEVEIKRAKIDIPTLDFEKLEQNIGYIQLYNFYGDATLQFKEITQEILKSNIKKLILDLRNNAGGYLSVACDIGNFFIKGGEVIVKEDFGKGKVKEITSQGPGAFANFKIVILINKGTASAAEILAGAIKEHNKNAKLLGEKTFGKGAVQELFYLIDDGSLKLTVARWLLPSGKSIEGEGISPDIEVKMTQEDIEKGKDPQLQRAIKEITK